MSSTQPPPAIRPDRNSTLRNLKEDLENVGSRFDGAPDLEFRLATNALELERSGLSYQRVPPGYRFPYGHTHKKQEEVYVVLRGSGRMKVDDELVELKEWDAMRVPPGTPFASAEAFVAARFDRCHTHGVPTDIYFAGENVRVKVDEDPGQVAEAFSSAHGLPFRLTGQGRRGEVYINPATVAFWSASEPGPEPEPPQPPTKQQASPTFGGSPSA